MKRQRGLIDDSVYPLFVTTTLVQWIPIFSDGSVAAETLQIFEQERIRLGVTVTAYVLMPNHVHAIMRAARKGGVSVFMRRFKSRSARLILDHCRSSHIDWLDRFAGNARRYKLERGQTYQVWMPRFDDSTIRSEKQFLESMNYIHGNPLKHHPVDDQGDYPYSSYADYAGGRNAFVIIDRGQGKP